MDASPFEARLNQIAEEFRLTVLPDLQPRYNISPTQTVPAVRPFGRGHWQLDVLHWGLIPLWSDDPTRSATR